MAPGPVWANCARNLAMWRAQGKDRADNGQDFNALAYVPGKGNPVRQGFLAFIG
jgi:hypothetical protein